MWFRNELSSLVEVSLYSALCHEAFCLDIVSNFFCRNAFCLRLRLYLIPLQSHSNTQTADTREKVATSHTSISAAKTIKNQLKVTFRTADCQQYWTRAASTSFSRRCIVANNKNVVGKGERDRESGGSLLVSCKGVWECKWMVHLTYSPNKLACHYSERTFNCSTALVLTRQGRRGGNNVVSVLHIALRLLGSWLSSPRPHCLLNTHSALLHAPKELQIHKAMISLVIYFRSYCISFRRRRYYDLKY